MLTALGTIGKVIEFVLTKLAGKRIDLALDEKKRAAQSFLGLFESVLGLEKVTERILRHFESVVNGKMTALWMPRDWTRDLADEIDRATREFLRHVQRLSYSISLIDPALGVMLGYISNLKADVLGILSIPIEQLTFSIAFDENRFSSFKFKLPSADVDEKSLESLYLEARKFIDSDFSQQVEWPKGSGHSLLGEVLEKTVGDRAENVILLSNLLSKHLKELQSAREQLRVFIAKTFRIEDLVFVSDHTDR